MHATYSTVVLLTAWWFVGLVVFAVCGLCTQGGKYKPVIVCPLVETSYSMPTRGISFI